jgi:threonine synthase
VLDEFRSGRYRVRAAAEHTNVQPVDGYQQGVELRARLSAMSATRCARASNSAGALRSRRLRAEAPARALRSSGSYRAAAPTPTAWRDSPDWQQHRDLIDPHTADGIKVARELRQPGEVIVALETALPVKFAETIVEAIGTPPPRPAALAGLEHRPRRCAVLPANTDSVKSLIAAHDVA